MRNRNRGHQVWDGRRSTVKWVSPGTKGRPPAAGWPRQVDMVFLLFIKIGDEVRGCLRGMWYGKVCGHRGCHG